MLNLKVDGMSCGHCVSTITKAIQSKYPKASANIDLSTQEIQIEGIENEKDVIQLIEQTGYKVSKT